MSKRNVGRMGMHALRTYHASMHIYHAACHRAACAFALLDGFNLMIEPRPLSFCWGWLRSVGDMLLGPVSTAILTGIYASTTVRLHNHKGRQTAIAGGDGPATTLNEDHACDVRGN